MRRSQHYGRADPQLNRLQPTRGANAPTVTGLEAGKTIFRPRRAEVVARRRAELEKFRRNLDTDGMAAGILRAGVARAIAKKPGQRIDRTGLQRTAEDVARGQGCHWGEVEGSDWGSQLRSSVIS